jgi:hypothetical protein
VELKTHVVFQDHGVMQDRSGATSLKSVITPGENHGSKNKSADEVQIRALIANKIEAVRAKNVFAYLTIWLAYFILLLVPWLTGRSLASTTRV